MTSPVRAKITRYRTALTIAQAQHQDLAYGQQQVAQGQHDRHPFDRADLADRCCEMVEERQRSSEVGWPPRTFMTNTARPVACERRARLRGQGREDDFVLAGDLRAHRIGGHAEAGVPIGGG